MTTALTKATRRAGLVAAEAFGSAMRIKQAGGAIDVSPSGGAPPGLSGWQRQQEQASRYGLNRGWAASAIYALASKGAGQPLVVARLAGSGPRSKPKGRKATLAALRNKMPRSIRTKAANLEFEILEDHPLVDLLEAPNWMQKRWQFVYSFVANLCLTGWSFVVVGEHEGKLELYSLPTNWVIPVGEKRLFDEFVLRNPNSPTAKEVRLKRNQVGIAQLPDPANPLAALSPATMQINALRIDEHIQSSQERFFDNGIFPTAIITMGKAPYASAQGGSLRPVLTGAQRSQLSRAIALQYTHDRNHGKPVILDGMIDSIERWSATANEMGWFRSEASAKARILGPFGVNPFVLGEVMNVGGHAQAEIIQDLFHERVNTHLEMLSNVLTNLLGTVEGDEKLLIWAEECKTVNPERRNSTLLSLRASGDISQNELRAEMGFGPDEDENEEVIRPSQMTGVGQILSLLGQGLPPEQAVATLKGMGLPTQMAKDISGINLPKPEPPPPPPRIPPPSGGEEEEENPEEEAEEEEAIEELKLANLLLAKALEEPERQAERILRSVERRGRHDSGGNEETE